MSTFDELIDTTVRKETYMWFPAINVKNMLLVILFFGYTFILLYITGSSVLDNSFTRRSHPLTTFRKTLNDYDLGSNGYSMDYRIKEQQRILSSVRGELIDASAKLDEVNERFEEYSKKIFDKQHELAEVEEQLESARLSLIELRDRRNVPIFLPHEPLYPRNPRAILSSNAVLPDAIFEDVFDYSKRVVNLLCVDAVDLLNSDCSSRCSIASLMPIFIDERLSAMSELSQSFQRAIAQHSNIVNDENLSCITVTVVDRVLPLRRTKFNRLIINLANTTLKPSSPGDILVQSRISRKSFDINMFTNVPEYSVDEWKSFPSVLPFHKKYLLTILIHNNTDMKMLEDITRLKTAALSSSDIVNVIDCSIYDCEFNSALNVSSFCIIPANIDFHKLFWHSLRSGCIPIVLSTSIALPLEDEIDWRRACLKVPPARFPEIHFMVRSIGIAEVLELRRNGRFYFENYLANVNVVARAVLAFLRSKLGVLGQSTQVVEATPLFNNSFIAPILSTVTTTPFDDEYLGPMEAPAISAKHLHNFTSVGLYSRQLWTTGGFDPSPEYLLESVEMPSDAEFNEDSNIGMRPIEPGSGVEFSRALGGNRAREQFTIVMVTYNRDAVLAASLERLHRLPYLNKVIVIWNNVDRNPIGAWPKLHVDVEFLRVERNSLNNRFIPWDRIDTEAVLSMDDDIDLKHSEIIFAFRVWRESRDRIVGFPARFHARFGDSIFYNSNHTCQHSMILTGAAFIHKRYFQFYTYQMPAVIRQHVDDVMNCEDIAMNFLVSHLSRKPPYKTTSKWTLRCPTCTETLSHDESHFNERHDCIRLFTRIYGYNPLKFSQFRVDSVLFKTRLPPDKQKCFKYV